MSDKNVRIFKTLQGVEYIGTLVEDNDSDYLVQNVFAVAIQQTQQNELHLGFGAIVHPIMGQVDRNKNGAAAEITLNKVAVVFDYAPTDQLRDDYLQAVSGIEIAKVMPGKM